MFGDKSKDNPSRHYEPDIDRLKNECAKFQAKMRRKLKSDENELDKLIEFGSRMELIRKYDRMKLISQLHSGTDSTVIEAASLLGLLLKTMERREDIDSIETALGIALRDTQNEEAAKCLIGALKSIVPKSKDAEAKIRWAANLHPSRKVKNAAKRALKLLEEVEKKAPDEREE